MAKRVPAKLHHELVEYASLLRALRVRDTLDLTKHLTKSNPFKLQPEDIGTELNSDNDVDNGNGVASGSRQSLSPSVSLSEPNIPDPGPSSAKSAKAKGKQKAEDSGLRKQIQRDHWTRWPVCVDDVLKPEWSLEDEVTVIVAQVMKGRPSPTFPIPIFDPADGDEDIDDDPVFFDQNFEFDEEDPDHPFYVPYIAASVAEYLSNVLAALACVVPARAASLQNRIEPLGWRAVIDVVATCTPPEFANPKVVENVIKRMEALYGPSILPLEGEKSTSFRAVERMLIKKAAVEKLNSKLEDEVAKYWQTPPEMLDIQQLPAQQDSGKRQRSATEEYMDAEFKGRVKPAPKKKRRRASAKPKQDLAKESTAAIPDGVKTMHEHPAAVVEAREEPPEQAGSSSQQGQMKEVPARKSMRSRRTRKVQVLDEHVINMG